MAIDLKEFTYVQADSIKWISISLGSFRLVLSLFIDVNDRIRCGISTCNSQIASGNVAFWIVIYICEEVQSVC